MYKKAQDVKRFLQRKSHHKVDEEREKVKKDLFAFTRCVDHGFPSKPSSLAYDNKLKLIAVGTKNGAIRIFGRPGVEFSAWHKQDCTVNRLFFLQEQGRLVSLCSDNSLHLWEINPKDGGGSVLEEVKEFNMETNKLKTVSACCLSPDNSQLLLGTEGGNIHMLDLASFTLTEQIIYQDVVMQNVPDDFKINPGAVEDIAIHPARPDKFLIGYNRGLVVLWDNQESQADKTYNASQQLESLCWHRSGDQFISAHSDGSYIVWSTSDASAPKEPATTPYGPFPCKAFSKIEWKSSKMDPYIVFSGGMPRASYGDRHTVSMMQGQNHVVFDFTSRIIDFIVLSHGDEDAEDENAAVAACPAEYDDPHTLVVLAEEELVVIDMETGTWPTHRLPYANSLHSSAITCAQHVANIPDQLWTKLTDAGTQQMKNYSTKDWPITGGKDVQDSSTTHDLLLTGHEDGTIRFWDASSTGLSLLYKLSTAQLFGAEVGNQDNVNEEEEWPPFRKVGTFDPYSDDPRLGIQRIALCPLSETLVVAGTAGQVMVMQMEREERTEEMSSVTLNIVNEKDNFVWKGHEALVLKQGEITFAAGFQPVSVMQLSPPAACSALAFHSEWQLVAAGTAHGFGLFDYRQKKEILTRCTLNPLELTGGVDTGISRRKSFKKSLRDSFRRLRRRRSEKKRPVEDKPQEEEKPETPGQIEVTTEGAAAAAPGEEAGGDRRPVERQVEARTNEDQRASLIRCLYFTDTFVSSGQDHTASLWAGSNAGHVFIYTITVPATDKRATENVSSMLAKEIKLRHKAPVISISVLDKQARILPDALEVQHQRVKEPDMTGDQQVIICSEEQFKIFSLPHLKPVCKVKLTASDGSRVRKVSVVRYRSKADENYTEYDVSCLTNQGELLIYNLPNLRRQARHYCLRKEDISGISSFIFTKTGQGFYLGSASEFSHISLSVREVTQPQCRIELKEGMRPPPPEPAETVAVIEITPPEGETTAEGGDAAVLEISAISGPDDQNESRADTTADITVDSVLVNPELVADESIIAGSDHVDAPAPATTEAHDTSTDEVTVVTTSDPEPIEISVSAKLAELEITAPAPASNETSEEADVTGKNPVVIEPEITVETPTN